jgi:hypothetical protein
MQADFKVFVDACVLANIAVCDLLLRLAERPRQFLPLWSNQVLMETRRVHEKLGWEPELAESFQSALHEAFPEAMVTGFEPLVKLMTNEEKDRHVLAAAVRGGAEIILTFNVRDFPPDCLELWSVRAIHPQDYLLTLYEINKQQVTLRVGAIAARRGEDVEDVLLRLGRHLPRFADRLISDLEL